VKEWGSYRWRESWISKGWVCDRCRNRRVREKETVSIQWPVRKKKN